MVSFRSRKSARRYISATGIAALCAIAAALLLLVLPRNDATLQQARQFALDILTPVYETAAIPFRAIRNGTDSVARLLDAHEENAHLRRANTALTARLSEMDVLRVELRQYQKLLALPTRQDLRMASARVVADLNSPFVRTLLANVGKNVGVRPGQAVIGAQGLIGRVLSVGSRSSRILLLNDFNSHVPVMVAEGDTRAILSGRNTQYPLLAFLPRKTSLLDGDMLITSGDGGSVPAGLPVGRVHLDDGAPARVELHEDLAYVDYVRIILSQPIDAPLEETR